MATIAIIQKQEAEAPRAPLLERLHLWKRKPEPDMIYQKSEWADRLGIVGLPRFRSLISELEMLAKKDMPLAQAYFDAAKTAISGYSKSELERKWMQLSISKDAQEKGREAVYGLLGIKLKPLPEEHRKKYGDAAEPIKSKDLFAMIIHGNLLRHALDMAGINEASEISIERVYAATGIYQVTLTCGDIRKRVFIDKSGVGADILAAELLEEAGIVVPKMMDVDFEMPNGEKRAYGVMQDIADSEGINCAVSLRALARNERMSGLVLDDFNGFAQKLGYAFEACRMLGIQDRHSRNLFVIEKIDGTLAIGMIDLDIVACYPEKEKYQEAFAGQLFHVLDSLYFAQHFGQAVRTKPECIGEELKKELPEDTKKRIIGISQGIAAGFEAGAEKSYSFYLEDGNQRHVKAVLKSHDGKAIGWGTSEARVAKLKERMEQLRYESKGTKRRANINGRTPRYISKGPDKGRITLKASDAWKNGFEKQLGKGAENVTSGFWKKTFDYCKMGIDVWVRKDGPLLPITTIAY